VLSFSASAGILLLMPPIEALLGLQNKRPAGKRKRVSPLRRRARMVGRYVLSTLCASLAAQLATLPFVIAFFGVQSILSLPFNLVCVPLCMAGYMLGLIALLLSLPLMPLAALLARIPDGLFVLLMDITRFGGAIPVAAVRFGRYPAALVLLHWLIVLASSELSKLRLSVRRFMPLALLAVAGLASLIVFMRAWDFSLVFLDADQADCAVVRTHGHTYLIDVGDTYTPAADYLNGTCLHLDGVVLTHPHQDHAGGLSNVLDSFRPDIIYVPEGWFEVEEVSGDILEGMDRAMALGIEVRQLAAGDVVELSDTAKLEVFSPISGTRYPEVNDMSLLTLITSEGHSALFTGDLGMEGEPETIPAAEVLKVAHHGSARGTSDRFLEACAPRIAVISVGENNYGHPSEQTLDKLANCGADVWTTRSCGAITLKLRGDEWRIDTYLEARHEVE